MLFERACSGERLAESRTLDSRNRKHQGQGEPARVTLLRLQSNGKGAGPDEPLAHVVTYPDPTYAWGRIPTGMYSAFPPCRDRAVLLAAFVSTDEM